MQKHDIGLKYISHIKYLDEGNQPHKDYYFYFLIQPSKLIQWLLPWYFKILVGALNLLRIKVFHLLQLLC